jgi:hypothetical protein
MGLETDEDGSRPHRLEKALIEDLEAALSARL